MEEEPFIKIARRRKKAQAQREAALLEAASEVTAVEGGKGAGGDEVGAEGKSPGGDANARGGAKVRGRGG